MPATDNDHPAPAPLGTDEETPGTPVAPQREKRRSPTGPSNAVSTVVWLYMAFILGLALVFLGLALLQALAIISQVGARSIAASCDLCQH